MDLYRIAIKLAAERATLVAVHELVPVFHRWIQTSAVEGMLIDVADYAHVQNGPGIMLIAHEGHYAMDTSAGRLGLQFERKRPMEGAIEERLVSVCRTTLAACRQLEEAPELEGRVRFPGNELSIYASDRLLAPNDEKTMSALRPALTGLLERLYDGAKVEMRREPDPRERFAVDVVAPEPVPVGELLGRLG